MEEQAAAKAELHEEEPLQTAPPRRDQPRERGRLQTPSPHRERVIASSLGEPFRAVQPPAVRPEPTRAPGEERPAVPPPKKAKAASKSKRAASDASSP